MQGLRKRVPEKPVIVNRDLEHAPGPDTRVNNSGVKIKPRTPERTDEHKERDPEADFDRAVTRLPPD